MDVVPPRSRSGLCAHFGLRTVLVWAALLASAAGARQFSFGVESTVEPATVAVDTILLSTPTATTTWSATSDKAWLHIETASGTGNGTIRFSVATNPDTQVRSGKITVGDQAFTVVQAGAKYVAARPLTTLVSSGLVRTSAYGVAVDASGNVYLSDAGDQTIKKWTVTTGVLSTLVESGIEAPTGIAVNAEGDVVLSDWDAGALKLRSAATGEVTTLLDGISPTDVVFDATGNVLFGDLGHDDELFMVNPGTREVSALFTGTNWPQGIAVDVCGNVFVADLNGNSWGVIRWVPGAAEVTPVVYGDNVYGVGVDGAGNVYFAQASRYAGNDTSAVGKWCAATGATEWLAPERGSWSGMVGMAVDRRGNVFIGDGAAKRLQAIPNSWVDPTSRFIGAAAGTDELPPVLPATTNLAGAFTPSSDQPWLTIESVAGGVVRFAFAANTTGADRTAHLTVLGQRISVTQSAGLVTLGARSTIVGPTAAAGTVLVAAASSSTQWTVTVGATWLHPASTSGIGDSLLGFSYDANPADAPRTGVITIGGAEFAITQAGAHYEAVDQYFPLATTGLSGPIGLAVDWAGNVIIADAGSMIVKWWVQTGEITILCDTGLHHPEGVALNKQGDVLIADTKNNAIKRWDAATSMVTTVWASGLSQPIGVAVDAAGNVIVGDSGHHAIKRWSAADQQVFVLVGTGIQQPAGVAVDCLGNVVFADFGNHAIKCWSPVDDAVTTVCDGIANGVAVDGFGNVYRASGSGVYQWIAATGQQALLAGGTLYTPCGVAVDGSGNVYFSDWMAHALYELPHAYVDTTPRLASSGQWKESFAPVLALAPNLTGAFAPTSDQPWLVIEKVEGGRIFYHTLYNVSGAPRTGHFTVLGRKIAVTQQTTDSWSYAAFQQWNFTPAECADPAISGPAADPSGRGVSNLLAYGLGLDPRNPDSGGLPRAAVVDGVLQVKVGADGLPQTMTLNGVMQVTFRKCSAAANLDYVVEASSDLVHWETTPTLANETVLDSMHSEMTYQDQSGAGAARRFIRVRVTKR